MTRPWFTYRSCPRCGEVLSMEEPWRAWVRSHPDLDSRSSQLYMCDVDLVVLQYGVRRDRLGIDRSVKRQMAIEVKTRGSSPDEQQLENLSILDARTRTVYPVERDRRGRFGLEHSANIRLGRGSRAVLNYGVHVLRMSGDRPDTSDELTWSSVSDGRLMGERAITLDQLVQVLRFDLHPDTLKPLEPRQHKAASSQLLLPID